VKAQTCQNFTWIIGGDAPIDMSDMPNAVVVRDPENYPNNRLFQNKMHMKRFTVSYLKNLNVSDDLILTSRLDCDDMLLPTYIEDAQRWLKQPGLLDFKGYMWDMRTRKFFEMTRFDKNRTSMFVTLAERPEKMKTVFHKEHSIMCQFFPVRVVTKRNWVFMIHNTNILSNKSPEKVAERGNEIHPINLVQRYAEFVDNYRRSHI
jgi:hypothetical protein